MAVVVDFVVVFDIFVVVRGRPPSADSTEAVQLQRIKQCRGHVVCSCTALSLVLHITAILTSNL